MWKRRISRAARSSPGGAATAKQIAGSIRCSTRLRLVSDPVAKKLAMVPENSKLEGEDLAG